MRPAVIGGLVAATALATLPQIQAELPSGSVLCDTGLYEIRAGYETARANACQVTAPRGVVLTIEPEDAPPINPSPWYGFHVRPKAVVESGSVVVTLRYSDSGHRYWPKISSDALHWEPLAERHWLAHEDGRATMELKPGPEGLFVSAQEMVGLEFYARWRRTMAQRFGSLEWDILGYSEQQRPLFLAQTAPDAAQHLLLIGRQHPPEVPGAWMFLAFAESLLGARDRACIDAQSPTCLFFARHNVILIPNLNPDGVAGGHWRHNSRGADLNRDWGRFEQAETRAVKDLVDRLEDDGGQLALMLDFHSTWKNVFYVPTLKETTLPPAFNSRWLRLARSSGDAYEFEIAPRASGNGEIAKNWFYQRFGIPAITVETGDETNRAEIEATGRALAEALITVLGGGEGALARRRGAWCPDFFCYLVQANKASLVMLAEQELVSRQNAENIAVAIARLEIEQQAAGAPRTPNYLDFEQRLVEMAGEEASNLHLGRSRQDLHGAVRRMLIRDHWLELAEAGLTARLALLDLAEQQAMTPIPAYTHGVQAQPTTLGHFLLAFSGQLERDGDRFRQGYARMNASPLGAAALGTSGFAVNRERLAQLLGFAAPVDNSYDANFVSSGDLRRELAMILALSATSIGQLAESLHTQYHNPRPWILLDESVTSGSTIMPQKRNPRPLDRVRSQATRVVGGAHTQILLAHNVNTGMHDYRALEPFTDLAGQAKRMYRRYAELIGSLRVDREQALEELRSGYSMMTEVADFLVREVGLPFRTAHRYASALTALARAKAKRATALSDEELADTYRDVIGKRLPTAPDKLRQAMDPVALLAARQGRGGPQPEEVQRMLREHRAAATQHREWLEAAHEELLHAWLELHTAFAALAPAEH